MKKIYRKVILFLNDEYYTSTLCLFFIIKTKTNALFQITEHVFFKWGNRICLFSFCKGQTIAPSYASTTNGDKPSVLRNMHFCPAKLLYIQKRYFAKFLQEKCRDAIQDRPAPFPFYLCVSQEFSTGFLDALPNRHNLSQDCRLQIRNL